MGQFLLVSRNWTVAVMQKFGTQDSLAVLLFKSDRPKAATIFVYAYWCGLDDQRHQLVQWPSPHGPLSKTPHFMPCDAENFGTS